MTPLSRRWRKCCKPAWWRRSSPLLYPTQRILGRSANLLRNRLGRTEEQMSRSQILLDLPDVIPSSLLQAVAYHQPPSQRSETQYLELRLLARLPLITLALLHCRMPKPFRNPLLLIPCHDQRYPVLANPQVLPLVHRVRQLRNPQAHMRSSLSSQTSFRLFIDHLPILRLASTLGKV